MCDLCFISSYIILSAIEKYTKNSNGSNRVLYLYDTKIIQSYWNSERFLCVDVLIVFLIVFPFFIFSVDYIGLGCCALAFVLYFNTLEAGFVYDDR